jgi:competence protein ComEA
MSRPPRIFWIALFVSAGYFLYRWRKQQAEHTEVQPNLGFTSPAAPPHSAELTAKPATSEASSTPRRIPTRVHKGAPPAAPLNPPAPAAPAEEPLGLADVPAENGDPELLGATPSALPAVSPEPPLSPPAEETAHEAAPASAPGLLNINSADFDALVALPGIGPALARRIISHREANGPFATVEQLIDIQGIGTRNIDEFRHLVTV